MILKSDTKFKKKADLLLGKWHEEFGKFSPEHVKVSKLELWWDPVVQSRKCMSLKFTEKLCVMTMKNDTKIEEELTYRFKIDMRNFTNFYPSIQKSKKFEFNWLLVTKVYIGWATKKFSSWHWRVIHILKKNWLVVWKKTIWQTFTRALESAKIGTLTGSFCQE